jgi:hypothetical protein
MPQLQNHLCRHAAEKLAIHARRSKTNPSNSQTADKAAFCCRSGCKCRNCVHVQHVDSDNPAISPDRPFNVLGISNT